MTKTQRCVVCGLKYDPKKKLPACGSEDGPKGPKNLRAEERKFTRCVLSVRFPRRTAK